MKKKLIAALAIFLTINTNIYVHAQDTNTTDANITETLVNKIEYSSIDKLILSRNITVKTNQNIIDKLDINITGLEDREDDIEKGISALRGQLSAVEGEISDIENKISNLEVSPKTDNEEGSEEDAEENTEEVIEALRSALTAKVTVKNMLESNIKSMVSQLDAIANQQEGLSLSVEKTKAQIEMFNNQIISGAENLILAYNNLELEEKKLDENSKSLQKQMDMLNLRKDLGFITEMNVKEIKLSMEDLNYAKDTMKKEKENLKRQLNIMLGQPYDTPMEIIFDEKIDDIDLNSKDKEKDLETAMDNSYNIKIKEHEVEEKVHAVDIADISYEYELAEEDLDDAKLNLDDTKRNEKLKFQKTYDLVKDKQETLDLENKKLLQEKSKLQAAELKYKLGMISKKDYDDAQQSYNLQLIKVESAEIALFNAYRSYEWMLKGLSGEQ